MPPSKVYSSILKLPFLRDKVCEKLWLIFKHKNQKKNVAIFLKSLHKLKKKKKASNLTTTSAPSYYDSWQEFFKPFLKTVNVQMMMMVSTFITGPLFLTTHRCIHLFCLLSGHLVFSLLPPKCFYDKAWLTVHWFQGLKIRDTVLQFMVNSLQSSHFLMTHSGVAVELFTCVYTLTLSVPYITPECPFMFTLQQTPHSAKFNSTFFYVIRKVENILSWNWKRVYSMLRNFTLNPKCRSKPLQI